MNLTKEFGLSSSLILDIIKNTKGLLKETFPNTYKELKKKNELKLKLEMKRRERNKKERSA